MSKWRAHVRNVCDRHKIKPEMVSPGGHVHYGRTKLPKLPQLPPPEFLAVDYPFILIDNWEIRIYPLRKQGMDWLTESTARWAKGNPCPEYRRYLTEFISTLERITKNPPLWTRRPPP